MILVGKTVKKNYVYNLIYQILLLVIPVITTPYLARVLGADGNGTYGYTISIVTYFVLFGSLGTSLYGQREIAYVQSDVKKRSKAFFEILIVRAISLSISMILFYLFFALNGEYAFYYRLLLLELVAAIFDISWFFQGLEDFKTTATRNFIVKLISTICIFAFVKEVSDIWIYILIYALSNLFGSLSLWLKLSKYLKPVKLKSLNFKKHLKPILALFIPQIAVQIYTVLDKSMLGFLTGDMAEVGYYEQSQKVVKILLAIITSMGTAMMPRIANCYSRHDKVTIQRYMEKTFNFAFILAFPMIFGIMAVTNNFVPAFFGEGYDKIKIILPIISFIILFIGLSNITGTQYLLPTNRQKEFTISIVIGAIINFVLNLILITYYQSIGACIATVIAELSVCLVQIYFTRKDFNYKKIFKNSLKYIMASVIMYLVCYLITFLDLSNALTLVTQVLLGALTYAAILVLIKDPFVFDNVNDIISRLKRSHDHEKKEKTI